MRWDLNNIFPSFSDESFLGALQYLESSIRKFLSWQRENLSNFESAQQKLAYCIDKFNEISLFATRLMAYANLKLSEDTNNSEALKYLNIIKEKFVDLSFAKVIFARYLKDLPLDSFTHPTLVAHKFVLNEAKTRAKYLLTDGEERILSMFRITGGEAWNQLTSKITANLMCQVQ
ncbi:MAG: peptidase M3, partial [Pseudothermotoga sp.]